MSYNIKTTHLSYKDFEVYIMRNLEEDYIHIVLTEPNSNKRFQKTLYANAYRIQNKTLDDIEELFNSVFREEIRSSYYYNNYIVERNDIINKITHLILEINLNGENILFSFSDDVEL